MAERPMAGGYNPYDISQSSMANANEEMWNYGVTRHFSAFTGADITMHFGPYVAGSIESLTYSITRETAPRYVMGKTDPVTFVRGKRAIAGSLVFSQFDRHAVLHEIFGSLFSKGLTVGEALWDINFTGADPKSGLSVDGQGRSTTSPGFSAVMTGGKKFDIYRAVTDVDVANALDQYIKEMYFFAAKKRFQYADQLPPFDVTVTMVNEQGDSATMTVWGVQLVNEGGGYSMDDISSNVAYSFVALGLTPLAPVYSRSSGTSRP